MSQSDQIEEALDLLQSIKDDEEDASAAVQQTQQTTSDPVDDPLIAAREEVDRLYEEHSTVTNSTSALLDGRVAMACVSTTTSFAPTFMANA